MLCRACCTTQPSGITQGVFYESRRFSTVEGDELDDSKFLTVDEHEFPTGHDLIFRQSAADNRTSVVALVWFTWLALLVERESLQWNKNEFYDALNEYRNDSNDYKDEGKSKNIRII
ncbi:MAG: hypothetical protein GY820_21545 [Gammaproteobacteria bacterium]|nr:hypothetical protein [Gammaproteobacteria bacterium]